MAGKSEGKGGSRLQKLLQLLDSGTSEATRKAAAKQITDITKTHPQQLPSVIRKVHGYLYHKNWETRVAAGEAIGHLAEAFPHVTVADLEARAGVKQPTGAAGSSSNNGGMTFAAFNLQTILQKGTALLASGGQEFDYVEEPGLTPQQRLEKQRQNLKKRLGLDRGMGELMDTDDLINDEDLDTGGTGSKTGGKQAGKQQATELLSSMDGLSARERNRLKRKAKALSRTDSVRTGGSVDMGRGMATPKGGVIPKAATPEDSGGGGSARPARGSTPSTEDTAQAECESDESEWTAILKGAWPFQRLCDQLCVDVLDPVWEVRHGAAVALREVLRVQAGGAGVEAPMADEVSGWISAGGAGKRSLGEVTPEVLAAATEANRNWLEDCLVLLLCVLALDRFADYGSDQVTAPVRETSAQALGVAAAPLTSAAAGVVVKLLEQLQAQAEWDVRYAGYLGLKYFLAARHDVSTALLPQAVPILSKGLLDHDDDVRAASADALVPVAPELIKMGHAPKIRDQLWSLLEKVDELSPATASVLQLLSHLYAQPGNCQISDALSELVPSLWPFLVHTLRIVRSSSMLCMERLLAASKQQGASSWLGPVLHGMLQFTFQQLLVEEDEGIQATAMRVWSLLLECAEPAALVAILSGAPLHVAATPAAVAGAAGAKRNVVHNWLALASTPSGMVLDTSCMVAALQASLGSPVELVPVSSLSSHSGMHTGSTSAGGAAKRARKGAAAAAPQHERAPNKMLKFVVGAQGDGSAVRMRMLTARALGQLCNTVAGQDSGLLLSELMASLTCSSATARSVSALVLWHWMKEAPAKAGQPGDCRSTEVLSQLFMLLSCSSCWQPSVPTSAEPYSEAVPYYEHMRRELLALITACMNAGWLLHTPGGMPVDSMATEHVVAMLTTVPQTPEGSLVQAAQARVQGVTTNLQTFEQYLHLSTLACCAAAVVRSGQLPPKMNQIIQPLMAAVRKEPNPQLQEVCARALAELMLACAERTPSPNDKLVRNVCTMAWSDPLETPAASSAPATSLSLSRLANQAPDVADQVEERLQSHKAAGTRQQQADGAEDAAAVAAAAVVASAAAAAAASPAAQAARITRLGAEATLRAVCDVFGANLWTRLPTLWDVCAAPLGAAAAAAAATAATAEPAAGVPPQPDPQSLINSLQVLKVVAPHVSDSLVPSLTSLLPGVCACSQHSNSVVRDMAARCIAVMADAWLEALMPQLLRLLVPLLSSINPTARLGAVEASSRMVSILGPKLVPYAVLLVVPLLRRMSDVVPEIRQRAATCFGSLVALLPLSQGVPTPPGLDAEQLQGAANDSQFLLQLLDNKKAEDYALPFSLTVTLRPYQQEGINWLAFLRRFGLHGVLADDMGLGKTIQASCIMASSLVEVEAAGVKSDPSTANQPLHCLVVCPSTLVQHWAHEMGKYIDASILRPVAYSGNPGERIALQKQLAAQWARKGAGSPGVRKAPNVLVMSYEHLRADVDWVAQHHWLYCVLDEGHVIKSNKTRVTQACKRVVASHRLLLSGTPIQNNVLELWSLFDFLMPGFLGAEKDFNARYGKALQAAKYSKKGSREAEAGLLAVDALHKQVMPFVLRRTKPQVLHDLPPKIVQDIYCDMSPLQRALYEDFQNSQASTEAATALQAASKGMEEGGPSGSAVHVFQALHYMRKLCSHPALVMDLSVAEHRKAAGRVLGTAVVSDAAAAATALRDVSHAPKLLALRELLAQCGIISGSDEGGEGEEEVGASAGHRLLVFAQMKGMLDLVERDVLVPGGVSFLRLDGSVEASQRFGIVQRFNSDPTIDVLLLTTSVGGLGLNLTSADTVVFLEHDWNPMKDLQAMDRAHRLGQTRTVNVYRLLMRGTLEERIMGLQQFKLDVANAVVNQENMSLSTMDTTQLLDLFGTNGGAPGAQGNQAAKATGDGKGAGAGGKQTGLQAMLANMGEMWDEKQYESEFDVHEFMRKMGKQRDGQ